MAEKLIRQYEILFRKAAADLGAAKLLLFHLNREKLIDIEIVLFHLQQSSEKLIKSILAYNNVHITKTHDIDSLIRTAKENTIILPEYINLLSPLSEYAVEGRYSIFHNDIEDAEKYIKILDELSLFAQQIISQQKQ